MRTSLKVLGVLTLTLTTAVLGAGLLLHEPRPVGVAGPAAEALADRLLAAVDAAAWDTTAYVAWDFAGRQRYRWWRDRDTVEVAWGHKRVLLHTQSLTGLAFEGGVRQNGPRADELVERAWAHFANDGFWLAAPFKVWDPGTTRALVRTEAGGEALLVTYGSGGVTPGDAYLWHLGPGGLPIRFEMWVSLLPVGGVDATWAGYRTLASGARVATRHEIAGVLPLHLTLASTDGAE